MTRRDFFGLVSKHFGKATMGGTAVAIGVLQYRAGETDKGVEDHEERLRKMEGHATTDHENRLRILEAFNASTNVKVQMLLSKNNLT